MLKYFLKYHAVDEPVKAGDMALKPGFTYKDMHDVEQFAQPYIEEFDEFDAELPETDITKFKKVKLMLCSRDIKPGDTFYDNVGRLWENAEECWVKAAVAGNNSSHQAYAGSHKIIGEISEEALTYVEEKQELTSDQVKFVLDMYIPYEHNWDEEVTEEVWVSLPKRGNWKGDDYSGKTILIKGPCKHFH